MCIRDSVWSAGATNQALGDPTETTTRVDLFALSTTAPAGDWDDVRFEGPSGTYYPATVSYPGGGYECDSDDWVQTDIAALGKAKPDTDFEFEVWQGGVRRKMTQDEFAEVDTDGIDEPTARGLIKPFARVGDTTNSIEVTAFCTGGVLTTAQFNALASRDSTKFYCRAQ